MILFNEVFAFGMLMSKIAVVSLVVTCLLGALDANDRRSSVVLRVLMFLGATVFSVSAVCVLVTFIFSVWLEW